MPGQTSHRLRALACVVPRAPPDSCRRGIRGTAAAGCCARHRRPDPATRCDRTTFRRPCHKQIAQCDSPDNTCDRSTNQRQPLRRRSIQWKGAETATTTCWLRPATLGSGLAMIARNSEWPVLKRLGEGGRQSRTCEATPNGHTTPGRSRIS
jgi:hypothetical protein